jgi:hypothetical protein
MLWICRVDPYPWELPYLIHQLDEVCRRHVASRPRNPRPTSQLRQTSDMSRDIAPVEHPSPTVCVVTLPAHCSGITRPPCEHYINFGSWGLLVRPQWPLHTVQFNLNQVPRLSIITVTLLHAESWQSKHASDMTTRRMKAELTPNENKTLWTLNTLEK